MSSKKINKILIIAIAAPIVVALLVVGGPALWQGIVTVGKAIVPNIWTLLAYIYIAFIAFMFGLKKGKKEKDNATKN